MIELRYELLEDGSCAARCVTVQSEGEPEGARCVVEIPEAHEGRRVTKLLDAYALDASVELLRIPASVTSIEDAFVYRPELGERIAAQADRLEVDADNPAYRSDGSALYTKDGKTLIRMFDSHATRYAVRAGTRAIADGAFYGCAALEEIELPEGLLEIGDEAFLDCKRIKRAVLPEGLRRVGRSAFHDDEALEELSLPSTLCETGFRAFSDCNALRKVDLPEGLERIGDCAFESCRSLEELSLPSTLREIESGAFSHCIALRKVDLPEGLERIGWSAFASCRSLEELSLPSTLRRIEGGAFFECEALRKVELPEGLERIGNCAFESCRSLEELSLPSTLREIAHRAFFGCCALRKVELPERLEWIGFSAFAECPLENLDLPSALRESGKAKGCQKHYIFQFNPFTMDLIAEPEPTVESFIEPVEHPSLDPALLDKLSELMDSLRDASLKGESPESAGRFAKGNRRRSRKGSEAAPSRTVALQRSFRCPPQCAKAARMRFLRARRRAK